MIAELFSNIKLKSFIYSYSLIIRNLPQYFHLWLGSILILLSVRVVSLKEVE